MVMPQTGCDHMVFDRENAAENEAIWNQYGSKLAANFGMKECGRPLLWGGKCGLHVVERRKATADRRQWKLKAAD